MKLVIELVLSSVQLCVIKMNPSSYLSGFKTLSSSFWVLWRLLLQQHLKQYSFNSQEYFSIQEINKIIKITATTIKTVTKISSFRKKFNIAEKKDWIKVKIAILKIIKYFWNMLLLKKVKFFFYKLSIEKNLFYAVHF